MAVLTSLKAAERPQPSQQGYAFTAYAVYRAAGSAARLDRQYRSSMAEEALHALSDRADLALRGSYDVSGYRADANLLLWLVAASPDELQDAIAEFRQSSLAVALEPVWSAIGVHRPTEIGKSNVPAYVRGEPAGRYVCVCPVTHTAEWYALDAHERRLLQVESDRVPRVYPNVQISRASAFGLGDHESIVAYECDEIVRLVDLIRDLGSAPTRPYMSDVGSYITGIRKPLGEIVDSLP